MNALVPNAALPKALQDYMKSLNQPDDLGAGITSGFAVISYKGKSWHTRYRGDETLITRNMVVGDGSHDPASSIEVIILKASPHISKVWYEKGFVDGEMAPPDCFSTQGIVPDAASAKPQSSACATCPKNVMGSKITDNGKKAKACSDSKRLAVVPLADIENAIFGGPMLLRTPAASLREIKSYSDQLNQKGLPYFALGTKISFDASEAFPKLLFSPVRVLSNEEIQRVIDYRADERVGRILDTTVEAAREAPGDTAPAAPAPAAADPFANLGPVPTVLKQVTPEVIDVKANVETEEQRDFREFQEAKLAKAAAAAKAEAEAAAAAKAAAAAAFPVREETEEEREFREFREAKAARAATVPASPVVTSVTRTRKPKVTEAAPAPAAEAAPAAPATTTSPASFDVLLEGLLPS